MNVFVYGTLLVPRIWELVTECPDLDSTEAFLKGHSIWTVKGATFPAIREESPSHESLVRGRVYFDIPAPALQRLDLYEDSFYERVPIKVHTKGGIVDADVYRAPQEKADAIVSENPWSLEWFEMNGLEDFLRNVFDH
ncbi:MAG: gamma-glutamylcyclotransferase [Verrucomicrobiales bacterium]|nr:gamma-glutamylcyclotransferase [Verrucomicrobiales bacterium]